MSSSGQGMPSNAGNQFRPGMRPMGNPGGGAMAPGASGAMLRGPAGMRGSFSGQPMGGIGGSGGDLQAILAQMMQARGGAGAAPGGMGNSLGNMANDPRMGQPAPLGAGGPQLTGPRMSSPFSASAPQIQSNQNLGPMGAPSAPAAGQPPAPGGGFGPAPVGNQQQQMDLAQSMYGGYQSPVNQSYGILGGGIGPNGTPLTAVDTLNRPQLGTPQTRMASEGVLRDFINQFGREQGLAQYRSFLDNQAVPLSAVGGGGDTAPVNLNRRLY